MPVNTAITFRKGSSTQWSNTNPVLASGEPGYDLSNNILKIGDGVSAWNSLSNHQHTTSNISGLNASAIELNYLQGATPGTGIGNKALVLDSLGSIQVPLLIQSYGIEASFLYAPDSNILNIVSNSGIFNNSLKVNNIPVSVSGHNHASSDITNFNSSVSGLFPSNIVTGIGTSGYLSKWTGSNSVSSGIIYDNGSSIGIGTSTPSGLLDIAGNVYVRGTENNFSTVYFKSSAVTDNTLRLRADQFGSLFLEAGSSPYLKLGNQDGIADLRAGASQLTIGHSYARSGALAVNQYISFNPSNTERMRITNVGDVGIGTTAPSGKLDLVGDAYIRGSTYYTTSATDTTTSCRIYSVTSGENRLHLAGGSNSISLWGNAGKLILSSSSVGVEIGSTFANAYVMFNPGGGSEKARITPSGFLGIGTSTPSGQLHVVGTGIVSSRLGINTNAPTNQLHVIGTGLIASATGLPANALLDVYSTTSGEMVFNVEGTNGSLFSVIDNLSGSLMSVNNNAGLPIFEVFSDDSIVAGRFNQNDFVISSGGNIGIGKAVPSVKLDIVGGVAVSGAFAATTKSFKIDHPSKPNYTLEYGSLESPYHGVRLTGRGVVSKGRGIVELPDYLKDLIHNDDTINIQLTNLYHDKILYVSNIDLANNKFEVCAKRAKTLSDLQFCWTLTGIRKDVEHLQIERNK